jgi:hypothetical protein
MFEVALATFLWSAVYSFSRNAFTNEVRKTSRDIFPVEIRNPSPYMWLSNVISLWAWFSIETVGLAYVSFFEREAQNVSIHILVLASTTAILSYFTLIVLKRNVDLFKNANWRMLVRSAILPFALAFFINYDRPCKHRRLTAAIVGSSFTPGFVDIIKHVANSIYSSFKSPKAGFWAVLVFVGVLALLFTWASFYLIVVAFTGRDY